mmetsp:Transcript_8475/g.21819  ORF Transcript_8475/g.21819 Transcript_8475/m.21819 type:complete len:168 (+) Transcript_8475:99-602(+)
MILRAVARPLSRSSVSGAPCARTVLACTRCFPPIVLGSPLPETAQRLRFASGQAAGGGPEGEGSDRRCQCLSLFGLEAGATSAEVRERYLELAKRMHPDAVASGAATLVDVAAAESDAENVDAAAAGDDFKRLRDCYELLMSEARGGRAVPDWLKKMKEDFAHYPAC